MDPKTGDETGTIDPEKQNSQGPSPTELLSSAKLVAEAAQATLKQEQDKVDKGKVAGAGADLLGAASHYGKLEEKPVGQYIEKAEDYLDQFKTSSAAAGKTSPSPPNSGGGESGDHDQSAAADAAEKPTPAPHNSGGESGGGFGQYFKMAEGFLKK